MGLLDWVHIISIYLTSAVIFAVVSSLMCLLACSSFLLNSDPSLIFVYFLLFSLVSTSFGFMVSTFFTKAKLAALAGPILLFGTVMPRYALLDANEYEGATEKYWVSLLSPSAFAFGADLLADYECK